MVPSLYSLLPRRPRTLLCALGREVNAPYVRGWHGLQATWMWLDRCRVAHACESRSTRGAAVSCAIASAVAMLKREGAPLRLESRALLIVCTHACVGALLVRFGLVVVRVCARTTYVAYEAINTWLL